MQTYTMNHTRSIARKAGLLLAGGLICASIMSLGGCAVGSPVTVKPTPPTLGQELIDLDAARNRGVLTEEEFKTKRAAIMNRKEYRSSCNDSAAN